MDGDVRDWLWRLERIEDELTDLIPARDLHVAFSVKIDRHVGSERELDTFPYGSPLTVITSHPTKYVDQQTGALWFDLGGGGPPFTVCWDWDAGFSVHDSLPRKRLKEESGEPVRPNTMHWCSWYYLRGKKQEPADPVPFLSRLVAAEEAIAVTCSLAPEAVMTRIGNLAGFNCWATALFYLAMKGIHPLIQIYGFPVFPREYDSKGEHTFSKLNDRAILLSPDYLKATNCAFEALRHAIENPGEELAQIGQAGESEAEQRATIVGALERWVRAIDDLPEAGVAGQERERGVGGLSQVLEKPMRSAKDPGGTGAEGRLARRFEKAWNQYQLAIQQGSLGSKPTDQDAYEWCLVQCEDSPDMPKLGTWKRYLRHARQFHGAQKNLLRRARRPGSSVVRREDIEMSSEDDA